MDGLDYDLSGRMLALDDSGFDAMSSIDAFIPGGDASVAEDCLLDAERQRIISELFRTHHARLCGFLARRLSNPDDASDLAQGAFVEAFRCLPRFAGRSHLSTWLYGIALNLLRSHLARTHARGCSSLDEAEETDLIDTAPSLHAAFETRAELHRVLDAIASAPPEQRETLLLVAIEGQTYEDAALRLDVAVGTVRSRVSRLRATLRSVRD